MILRLAAALLALPACVVHYTVGEGGDEGDATTCPEGQLPCDGSCAPACAPCEGDACETPTTAAPTGDELTGASGDEQTGDTAGDGGDTAGTCGDGLVACGDTCTAPESCCDPACDPALEVCSDAACACRPGLDRCGEACVDTRSDPDHCGGCDKPCGGGVCQNGGCREGCAPDLDACDGACVETSTDSLHCGDCATLCAPDEVCLAGTCRPYAAADGCDACPCPACGDGLPTCCAAPFLDVPVCVAAPCTGE